MDEKNNGTHMMEDSAIIRIIPTPVQVDPFIHYHIRIMFCSTTYSSGKMSMACSALAFAARHAVSV